MGGSKQIIVIIIFMFKTIWSGLKAHIFFVKKYFGGMG